MLPSRWSLVRRAVSLSLLALLCLFGCNHGPSPSSALLPVGVASLRSSGAPPGDTVGPPSPGFPRVDNAVCPAYDAGKLPAPLSPTPSTSAGTIPGSFAVSPSGQATYTMPLAVPPGRLGMEPRLAITYSSSGGEGPLGVGFALQGLSAITRCPSNMAQDGQIRAVANDDEDHFCIDGVRLVPVPTKQSGATKEWRTFPDTMRKVVSRSGASRSVGPQQWTVYERNGDVRAYGATPDSRAMATGGTVAACTSRARRTGEGTPSTTRTRA